MTPAIAVLAKTLMEEMVHFRDTIESDKGIDDIIGRRITERLTTFKETFERGLFYDEEVLRCVHCFLDFLSFTLQGIYYTMYCIL